MNKEREILDTAATNDKPKIEKKDILIELESMIEKCEVQKRYLMNDYKEAKDEQEENVISLMYIHWDMHFTDLKKIQQKIKALCQ